MVGDQTEFQREGITQLLIHKQGPFPSRRRAGREVIDLSAGSRALR